MLTIDIPEGEFYDSQKEIFVYTKPQRIVLEHSLVSIAKWESKWKKSFLSNKNKTAEEALDYIRCMTITQNVDEKVYLALTQDLIETIFKYVEGSQTATYVTQADEPRPSKEPVTADVIYYWMVSLNIPFECQKWHLSRLFSLINVCSVKNAPPKKMSRYESLKRTKDLNRQRRKG